MRIKLVNYIATSRSVENMLVLLILVIFNAKLIFIQQVRRSELLTRSKTKAAVNQTPAVSIMGHLSCCKYILGT